MGILSQEGMKVGVSGIGHWRHGGSVGHHEFRQVSFGYIGNNDIVDNIYINLVDDWIGEKRQIMPHLPLIIIVLTEKFN